jgi:hypothetical protein
MNLRVLSMAKRTNLCVKVNLQQDAFPAVLHPKNVDNFATPHLFQKHRYVGIFVAANFAAEKARFQLLYCLNEYAAVLAGRFGNPINPL